jgi:hypothetical protein
MGKRKKCTTYVYSIPPLLPCILPRRIYLKKNYDITGIYVTMAEIAEENDN